ncbi:hypothetical protein SDJN02_22008, partial [Cucurbita argyrosperma subsp. argyrosperma]
MAEGANECVLAFPSFFCGSRRGLTYMGQLDFFFKKECPKGMKTRAQGCS